MPDVTIREADIDDAQTILDFIIGLAEFENEPRSIVKATVESIRRDGFGDNRLFETLIAERDDQPVGMALFFPALLDLDRHARAVPGRALRDFRGAGHRRRIRANAGAGRNRRDPRLGAARPVSP